MVTSSDRPLLGNQTGYLARAFLIQKMIRKARKKDVDSIYKLVKIGSQEGQVLLRTKKEIKEVLKFFFVAEIDRKTVGCASLEIYSPKLAEVRSLVVLNGFRKLGIGTKLVKRCIKEARKKQVYEILSITDKVDFFYKFGFRNELSGQSPLFKRLKKR